MDIYVKKISRSSKDNDLIVAHLSINDVEVSKIAVDVTIYFKKDELDLSTLGFYEIEKIVVNKTKDFFERAISSMW